MDMNAYSPPKVMPKKWWLVQIMKQNTCLLSCLLFPGLWKFPGDFQQDPSGNPCRQAPHKAQSCQSPAQACKSLKERDPAWLTSQSPQSPAGVMTVPRPVLRDVHAPCITHTLQLTSCSRKHRDVGGRARPCRERYSTPGKAQSQRRALPPSPRPPGL